MKQLTKEIQNQFDRMCQTRKLFRSNVSGDQIWQTYLNSFQDDPIFRDPESSVHNCNYCKNFIRRYGNIVAIIGGDLVSIFSNLNVLEFSDEYLPSMEECDELVRNSKISNVFFENTNSILESNPKAYNSAKHVYKLGIEKNHKRYTKEEAEKFGVVKPNEIRTFNHFHLDIPELFVDKSGKSIESIQALYRDKYSVFKRALEEISLDTLVLVKDLINQGSLLDGTAHLHVIDEMIPWAKMKAMQGVSDTLIWDISYSLNERTAKFKNTLIGVLCSELAEGKELNKACQSWNKRVDPVNYHKASAPITQKQIKEAQKFVEENDYVESFNRRFATIDDIKASEIKHINVGTGTKSMSIFDNVKPSGKGQHKRSRFDNVEEVSIERFMADILPNCSSVEAYLENRMVGNMVTMTTGEGKPIFKWNNNYSWTFNGNLAGKSQLRDAVKSRGGNVDGVLNIRLAFPETTDDYDLHITEPNKNSINFGNVRKMQQSSGMLDLDAQGVDGYQVAEKRVENITYSDLSKMPNGDYRVFVHDYSANRFRANFLIEIETPDELVTMTFNCKNAKFNFNKTGVAIINLRDGKFTIIPDSSMELGESTTVSKQLWNLETNNFHKVNLMCLSPNHWGENAVGNKHYMFMLEDCKSDVAIRSFHNENLNEELLKHRKVMEVLGTSAMLEPVEKQLSGLGFNSTVKDELIVKCKGNFNGVLKIKF